MRDKIVVLDDEENLLQILRALLERVGYEVFTFSGLKDALPTLNEQDVDVVLTDLAMPEHSGMDVLRYCKRYSPDLPVVLLTAFGSIEIAVTALKAGAYDFVLKPFEHDELMRTLSSAVQSRRKRKREPALDLMSAVGLGPVPVPLFGSQKETVQLRVKVDQWSKTRSHVALHGEVGTGKRSVAYEVHRRSECARGPFIQLNCDAIPEAFQMSELFGSEPGALPLSVASRPGRLELANGGTLFLEEVTGLTPAVQNALLQAIEDGHFTRLGGVRKYPFDIRLIVSSKESLIVSVDAGLFHSELFLKLAVDTMMLQPLRNRLEDLVTHLIPHFAEAACMRRGIPFRPLVQNRLDWAKTQPWPGNLGELERWVQSEINR